MKVSGKRPLGAAARAAAPLAALLLLTGCGQLGPGTAASVNGHRITMQQVDDLVDAQCDAAVRQGGGQPGSAMPLTQVQRRSLGLLLEIELTKQYAAAKHLKADPRVVEAYWSQYRGAIQQLPEQTAKVLSATFHDFAQIRAVLVDAGSRATGQPPSPSNLQDLTQAGLDARQKWLDDATVHTDPRFGPDQDGFPGAGDGSVSRPVSDFAKKASAAQADPEWVSSLPARQKCG